MLFVICNRRKIKILVACILMVLCRLYAVLIDHPSFVNLLTSKMDKPNYAEWNFSLLSIGPVYLRFKGCWVVFFVFGLNSILFDQSLLHKFRI